MKEPDYHYIVYIDEAGDDGLTKVRPLDPSGSSEWLVISGVVVRASREDEVSQWVQDIRRKVLGHQARSLHFAKLSSYKKLAACEALANAAARYFVVCSNKKNMKGHYNPLASEIPSSNWFYCWMTRLLLERVTDFIYWHSIKEHGAPKRARIEFSNRGGLSYPQMSSYFRWISFQGENTFLKFGRVYWDIIEYELLKVYPHYERAGLQLADIVASAFYKACDKHNTGECDPRFAEALKPRMARYRDNPAETPAGYGVKLIPGLSRAALDPDQASIFKSYGYPIQWWAPDPSDL